jgi:small subunit ribosomal protein S2
MAEVTMKQLLEAGVHFGHQTSRWNPKMKPYIFGARNGIYIIDLQQTVKLLQDAYAFIRNLAANGGSLLMVGTKKQAQDAVMEEAERCAMYYVSNRWLGGTLTNFQTIKQSVDACASSREMLEDVKMSEALKRELLELGRERTGGALRSAASRPCANCRRAVRDRHHQGRDRRQGGEQARDQWWRWWTPTAIRT